MCFVRLRYPIVACLAQGLGARALGRSGASVAFSSKLACDMFSALRQDRLRPNISSAGASPVASHDGEQRCVSPSPAGSLGARPLSSAASEIGSTRSRSPRPLVCIFVASSCPLMRPSGVSSSLGSGALNFVPAPMLPLQEECVWTRALSLAFGSAYGGARIAGFRRALDIDSGCSCLGAEYIVSDLIGGTVGPLSDGERGGCGISSHAIGTACQAHCTFIRQHAQQCSRQGVLCSVFFKLRSRGHGLA